MMRLIAYIKDISLGEWVVGIVISAAFAAVVVFGVHWIGSAINESRVTKLETEKQQALKERDEARAQDLILQGQIIAKDEVIKSLTSQIAESDAKVVNAHKETVSAKSGYTQVRSDPPKFNNSDDASRVLELGAELHGLYPDSP